MHSDGVLISVGLLMCSHDGLYVQPWCTVCGSMLGQENCLKVFTFALVHSCRPIAATAASPSDMFQLAAHARVVNL